MFEGVVAYALNKYLGKYVEDLDSEQLNVGIFSGTVQLSDLHLKPEAFAELGWPIEVKGGCVAKISIDIPWTSLYYDPVLIHVEEILILAGPVVDRKFDPERDKRLMRAAKKSKLESTDIYQDVDTTDKPQGFVENLATAIVNNVQVSIQNVHIRYEDTVSNNSPFACGLVLQNLTAITTNNKWKPTQIDSDAKNIFKLLKVESFSLYWNPACPANTLVKAQLNSNGWKTLLRKGLATFSINGEDFDFILKPVSLKVKMILNKSKEAKVPKLLLDFVLQDAASQLSRDQFMSIYMLSKSFEMMAVNQRYRKYYSGTAVKGHAKEWWQYAYRAVVNEYLQPYTWSRILEHRRTYRKYKTLYKECLQHPNDTELKLDLQLEEDKLDVTNILLAREEAKKEIIKEQPSKVKKVPVAKSFWSSWFESDYEEVDGDSPEENIIVIAEKEKSWWARMTNEEKERLYEGIGYEVNSSETSIPPHYIAHKLNFTLANCTLSLMNYNHEILVVTVTHFLSSLETRPGAKAFKLSARTESFVVEGASVENDLVPILTADNITSGSNVPHVFSLDFEKSPLHVKAKYGLIVAAEPMEVVYHKYAVSELLTFLQLPKVSFDYVKHLATEKLQVLVEKGKANIIEALSQRKTIHLNIDLKSPYFVIPEHGSLQQSGSVIVLDMGRLTVNTDLQADPSLHEEATKMEAEERLYDRFNVSLSDIQVLFSDSGDEWRAAKQVPESDIHLVPKTRIQVVFSNSVKPDYRILPRQKLNVSVPALKLNLSDRRVSMIMEFIQNLPLPKSPKALSPSHDTVDAVMHISDSDVDLCKHTIMQPSVEELKCLRRRLNSQQVDGKRKDTASTTDSSTPGQLERYYSASDHSDDESEEWARVVDLPGFDDNVSPSNSINVLLRFIIGEIAVHLSRSSDHADKPYLMLRAEKLCIDVALMEYGPALQASLNRIQLVDKLHTGSSGEYLELVSSAGTTDMITILYRKVQANCPDFKSHFHQVEHSLVLDLATVKICFHREAFMTLGRFLQYIAAKLRPRFYGMKLVSLDSLPNPGNLVFQDSSDPPIPPGATKFSISARMNAVTMRLCDTDLDLADLKVAGLECDYVLKANEKSVLRLDLTELSIEDLMEQTLYSKVLSTEDDSVFDIKFVKNSPHHHKEIDGNQDSLPMKVDGSIRVRFGRMIVVLVQSFMNELQRFWEPFLHPETTASVRKSTEGKLQQQVFDLQKNGLRFQLSIDIHAPTLLLPQKPTSPNALIISLGDLSVENFFQEIQAQGNTQHYVDNILVRLNSLQISRAVILIDSKMEIREPILEPLKLRLDIKRALSPYHKEILLYEISGSMDIIKINVGQRDLSTIIAIYQDNYSQMKIFDTRKQVTSPMSPINSATPTTEDSMKKLEVFLYTSADIYKETSFAFIMEGMHVTLYTDGEELHSSPVRDPNQALSMFEIDEVSLSFESYNDKSMELRCSCQAATLLDLRAARTSALKKIFQSYSGDSKKTGVAGISLSMPPMVDLVYRQTASGDAAVDVVIEKIRLNVSVCYLLAILKFVSDALPGKHTNGIFCEADAMTFSDCKDKPDFNIQHRRLPSDSTSGYHSNASGPEDSKGLSISAVLRKPEIILFADPMNVNSEVVVLKMDVMFDYSFNLGQANCVVSISGLHILSCVYGRRKQTMCIVLHPCEAEFTKTQNATAEESKMIVSLSSINLCLSAPVAHTIIDVVQELMKNIQDVVAQKKSQLDNKINQNQDLWSPVNVTPQKWMESRNSLPMKTYMTPKFSESLTISVPDLQVIYEIPGAVKRIPVFYAKCSIESEIGDWSHQINMKGELKLEVMYFNEMISTWEPLLEHVMINEGNYRAVEFVFKVFRDRSYPIWCPHNDKDRVFCSDVADRGCHLLSGEITASSSSSGNETEEEDMMTIIKRQKPTRLKRLSSIAKSHDSSSLLAYPPDSDSENEDGMLEKIASTFDHLFSDEGSDDNPSDSEGIADVDTKSDSGETETADNDESTDHSVFMMSVKSQNADEDEVDNPVVSDMAVYVTVDCRDHININVTPTAISVMQEVVYDFASKRPNRIHPGSTQTDKSLVLKNFLGPESVAKALKKIKDDTYETVEEASGKMTSSVNKDHDLVMPLVDISPPDSDSEMAGDETDVFHISSALLSHKKLTLVGSNLYKEKEVSELYKESTREKLSLEVDGFDKLVSFIPARTTTSMYALHPAKNKTRYYVLVGTELCHGQKTVTVYSPLKVKNHLLHPVHLLCQKSTLEALGAVPADYSKNPFQDKYIRLTTLDVDQVYNVPLLVAYHCKLFIQPVLPATEKYEYTLSDEGIWWQDITVSQRNSKFLLCRDSQNEDRKFCVKVVCIENKEVKTPAAGTRLIPNYILHLYPPIVVHNIMPVSTVLHLKHSGQQLKLNEGENVSIFDLNPYLTHEVAVEVVQYLGIQWHGKLLLSGDLEEHHPILMMPETDTEGGNRHLSINVQITKDCSMDIFLFCPYWVINKTGLPLQFRGSSSDVIYEIMACTDPVLFRFKKHRRKKAKLRVYSSQWSHSFSLDTVGNHGIATCIDKERNKKYRFFVSIQMSKLLLTKIVTIKPYLLVHNETENHLRFMEKNDSTDLWFDIAPGKCLPFWPDTDSMKMFVKQRDSSIVSQNFPVNKPHVTVLRMDHGSALRVEVKGGEDMPTTISFNLYVQGDAPVRVENLCEDLFLKIHQKCQGQVTLLSPYQSVLYTWDDPTQERTLIWNLYNRKKPGFPAQIFKDGYGHEKVTFHSLRRKLPSSSTKSPDESSSDDDFRCKEGSRIREFMYQIQSVMFFACPCVNADDDSEFEDLTLLPKKTRKDKVVVYWISYMEDFQRVLLFTQDDRIAREARKAVGGENSSVESFLSLNGVGISLISASYEELAYLSLSSCPAIWEIEINHTWKLLTLELSAWLEDKWQNDQQKAQLKDYLQVDLGKMLMIKPFFGQLRRFYSPAVWCQLRKSKYQLYAHMKLHRFQIDNQLPDAIFPTVIHPGPTPQPVVKRSGPKPFIECGILLHKSSDQSTKTVKYFKLLMQELHLKLDKGFLLSLYDMYTKFQDSVDEERKLKDDIESTQAPIYTCKECEPSTERIVFEYVHFSPLKIHFSFSPRGSVHKVKPDPWSLHSDILDVLLNSVGATISEMKDVELRMAFFEKNGVITTLDELFVEVRSHYQLQLVQQSYVLILGLDILGNPYGLVRDFTKGLGDFFYEPFLGSVKSPDEFADSLAKGAQSLLGHVIGGSAGAVSLLSGSLGQALSVLTFDEEYRKKRQLYMQQHPSSLPVTLLTAAKGFVLGIALGLSGVVVKPLTGAQQEGVEGFFRGVGKGLLGLITKPAGGVMDMVSMAFDGIRRAAEMGENVVARIRLPRFINPTMGLRPYSPYQASGCQLLQHISKGHYADTDIYWAHASLSKEDRSDMSLITDKHMFLLEKCRFWGGWDIEWVISIDDIMTVPHINGTKLVIKVKQDDSVMSFAGDERYIQCEDIQVLEWLKDKIEKVLLFNMKEKPCPVDV